MTKVWCTFTATATFVAATVFTACSPTLTDSAELPLKRRGNLRLLNKGDSSVNESTASIAGLSTTLFSASALLPYSRKYSLMFFNDTNMLPKSADNQTLFPCPKVGGNQGSSESSDASSANQGGTMSTDTVGSVKHGSGRASLPSSLVQKTATITTSATSGSTTVAAMSKKLLVQGADMAVVRHSATNITIIGTSTRSSTNGTTAIIICVGKTKCIGNTGSAVISSSPISSIPPTVVPVFAPSTQPTVSPIPKPVTTKPATEVVGIIPTATSSPMNISPSATILHFAPTFPRPKSSFHMRQRPAKVALDIITTTPTVSVSPVTLCTPSKSKAKPKRSPSTPSKSKAKPTHHNTTTLGNSIFSVKAITGDDSITVNANTSFSCCAQELPILDTKDSEHPQALSPSSLFNNNNSLALSNGKRPTMTRDGSNDLKSKVTVGSVLKIGVINGTIFHDTNSNGVQDKGEVGIDRLVVQIFDTTNSASTTTPTYELVTDRTGFYQFDQLPLNRDYTVLPDLSSIDHSNYIAVTTGIFSPVKLTELHRTAQNNIGINDGNAIDYFGPSGLVKNPSNNDDDDA
jgi:hypothetical protein